MFHLKKRNNFVFGALIFAVVGILEVAKADVPLLMNGDILSSVEDGDYIKNINQYKAYLEDYVEGQDFEILSFIEKEKAVSKLVDAEVGDISLRILRQLQRDSGSQSIHQLGEEIENKLQSLMALSDVLSQSHYPQLEVLVNSGVQEPRDLYIFQDDGQSLCERHDESSSCRGHKRIFLRELIEKIPNDDVKNRLIEIVQNFSVKREIPEKTASCLNSEKTYENSVLENKDSSTFCGITHSHKIHKAVRKGISVFAGQEPEYTCLSVNLNLIKVSDSNGRSFVGLDPNKTSYLLDGLGKRVNIGNEEFKQIQKELEQF
ncbi:MAG: hypothetical protein ACXVCN_10130 [Bdellovibrio sp.]